MDKQKIINLKLMAISLVVGIVAGLVVGAFRFAISQMQTFWLTLLRLLMLICGS